MLLEVTREITVQAPQAAAWALLRDVERLSGCIPKVSDVHVEEPNKRYTALVSDRLGPFSLQVPLRIEVQHIEEPRHITANLAGDDKRGQARVRGSLEATADAQPGGDTQLTLNMRLEVLGKLASLGAIPIRRRADDIFSEFAQRVRAELDRASVA